MTCRHCHSKLTSTFIDLGAAPPSNAYLSRRAMHMAEKYLPLCVKVCTRCWLAQTEDDTQAVELFDSSYAYFSSLSTMWLNHAARYADKITQLLQLTQDSFVVEIACNDGYLLKNFVKSGIPCLGIEPTASTAGAAEKLGIPVMHEFFGELLGKQLAMLGKQADLIIGNNVYAHVPDINGFTQGMRALLKPGGTITMEFPHLMRLIEQTQFDTIYHEHFSYLSLYTVDRIFKVAGLRVLDVEELPTHGGSLRVYACHAEDARAVSPSVKRLLEEESLHGLQTIETYQHFQVKANRVKDDLIMFLIEQKRAGKKVAAYGAAAKGNTLLNYAGVKPDLLPYVCDAALSKQGKFMPGSRIPILPSAALKEDRPDYVLIIPWNLREEIMAQLAYIREWGGRFVTAVPELKFH
ncbi:MAG: class I SAM-dependent methyltransferase [Proteobacteria bacterium]|nr:class I SAM-dependent methyltransferase [Pseudomonadota bacterium]